MKKLLLSCFFLCVFTPTAFADSDFMPLTLDFNLSCKVFQEGKHTVTKDFKKGGLDVLPSSDKNTLHLWHLAYDNEDIYVAYFKVSRISGTGSFFGVSVPVGMMTKVFNDFASNISYSAFKSKYKNYEVGNSGNVECKKVNKNLF